MKFTIISVAGKTFALKNVRRIIHEYELRFVPGETVKAMHLGTPFVDLGMLLVGKPSKQIAAVKLDSGFGYLVDSVVNEVDCSISDFQAYSDIITNQKGSVLEGTINILGNQITVIATQPNKHLKMSIENELKDRSWI